MKMRGIVSVSLLAVSLGAGAIWTASAQAPPPGAGSPVALDWIPPALAELSAQAGARSSFTLDRNLLAAASAMVPDSEPETRQAIRKIDGVSVHLLRFGQAGIPDESEVKAIRDAYHQRGWKHLVANGGAGPIKDGTTDVWLVLDGASVRGAVVLVESPKSLTLATMAGDLNPVDLLHLRGHFGIPQFDGDGFRDEKNR